MSTLTTTIELGATTLEVEIEYEAIPGERAVMYTKNGDGYPGSPPYADLIGVKVLHWQENERQLSRGEPDPVFDATGGWGILDKVAFKTVDDNWKRFGDMCLEDANERDEAARDAADEAKYERYRNGD